MTFRVDVKSVVMGLALGAAVVLALGAAVNVEPQVKRYAIGASETHAFVLDTVTGQVWEKFTPLTSGQTDAEFGRVKLEAAK